MIDAVVMWMKLGVLLKSPGRGRVDDGPLGVIRIFFVIVNSKMVYV